jgi:DNA-binding IclR family transcriptional regulator
MLKAIQYIECDAIAESAPLSVILVNEADPSMPLAQTVKDSKAPAISRAAAVLRLLGKSNSPLTLAAIARELALVPSTCLYVLRALVAEDLVAFDPDTKRYSLEAGVLTLARQWLRRDAFADLAQPALDRLAGEFDVTAQGVQIMGLDNIVAVAVSRAGGNLRVAAQVGSRFPALISATGRCIAAFGDYPEAQLKERFDGLHWDNPPVYAEWLAQVAMTRAQGIGLDDGNYIAGVTVLAAPVWKGSGRPSHALVTIGIGSTLKQAKLAELQAALRDAASAITRQLGGEPLALG